MMSARAVVQQAREDAWVEQTRMLGMAFLSYAIDNNANFPDGKSSTEVFQKLIDGRYIADPAILILPIPNKTAALSGQKLKPENVCFDVTCCLDISAPDSLPLIYMTGYKIAYKPNGAAVPLAKTPPGGLPPGLTVMYKNNSTRFLRPTEGGDGSIPNFMPSDYPTGKDYHQLTPDGAMKP
jgi:hypothetical protein